MASAAATLRTLRPAAAAPFPLPSPQASPWPAPAPVSAALTVVVPTLNERANVELLVAALTLALAGIAWEVVFVDDGSTDGTPELVTALARADGRVRLIRRIGRRGLASAVIEGALASTAPHVAVMDADLQHDEQALPRLYAEALAGADLVVATRYGEGGALEGWSKARERISRIATRLAALVLPTPVSDPMSGFFVVEREAFLRAAPRLSGVGYKILLDVIASSPAGLRVAEVPYTFRDRMAGRSKLSATVALEYLQLLVAKLSGRWAPPRFVAFGLVGGVGLCAHLAVLGFGLHALRLPFAAAQGVAVMAAMTLNFCLNNAFTYRDRKLTGMRFAVGLASFYAVCGAGAVANVGVGTLASGGHSWWLSGVAGAVVGSVWNFAMSAAVTWRRRS